MKVSKLYTEMIKMTELPKYVEKDLQILYNYEFKTDKYGYTVNTHDKMALKLFQIAKKYPQKWLSPILEYFGYFYGEEELEEKHYRDEILHLAEYHFKLAMDDIFLMYDGGTDGNIKKQIPFIQLGLIGGWYENRQDWKKKKYVDKYPQKSIDR